MNASDEQIMVAKIARLEAQNAELLADLKLIVAALCKDSREKSILADSVEYHLDGQAMYYAINAARAAIAAQGGGPGMTTQASASSWILAVRALNRADENTLMKTFTTAEWRVMRIISRPTSTHSLIQKDSNGVMWEWVACYGDDQVKAKQLTDTGVNALISELLAALKATLYSAIQLQDADAIALAESAIAKADASRLSTLNSHG